MIYSLDDIITFGKHQGRTISEIITGLGSGVDGGLVVMFYLRELFNFLSNNKYAFDVRGSNYFIDFIGEIYGQENYNTPYHVPFKSCNSLYGNIYIEKEFIILRLVGNERIKLNNLICEFLLTPFKDDIILRYDKENEVRLSPNSLKIRPDPTYIIWAIKNIPDFIVHIDHLEGDFICRKLYSFDIIPIDLNDTKNMIHISDNPGGWFSKADIIEYKPIIKEYKFSFPDHIKKLNHIKYNTYMKREKIRAEYEVDNNYNRYEINGKWLSNDTINSAFEGDPLNYWNID